MNSPAERPTMVQFGTPANVRGAAAMPGVSVEFDNVVKAFGPVQVLHGVSFALAPGRVYGLLGENGAGKSTLMKILAGYESLTGGVLRVNGAAQVFTSSKDAEALGIVLIHQEFNLAEDLSVAQNIFLGHEKKKRLVARRRHDGARSRCGARAGRTASGSDDQGAPPHRR